MTRYSYEHRIKQRHKRAESRRIINQEKINRVACIDCGLKVHIGNVVAFDFDHVDREDKTQGIAEMAAVGAPNRIREELAKCVLRCAVCHRLKTYADRDYLAVANPRLTDTTQLTLFEETA